MLVLLITSILTDLSDFNIRITEVSDNPTSTGLKKKQGFNFMNTKDNSTASLIRGLSLISKRNKERLLNKRNENLYNEDNLIDSLSSDNKNFNNFAIKKSKKSSLKKSSKFLKNKKILPLINKKSEFKTSTAKQKSSTSGGKKSSDSKPEEEKLKKAEVFPNEVI